MHLSAALSLVAIVLSSTLASAQVPAREIRRSPDGRYFVGRFDHDAGAPFGVIRPIVVRSASDPYDMFSFVSVPRFTDAAWNPASTRCVIADAPDNGGPKTWLMYQKTAQEWASREIEPFATLDEAFRKTDPEFRHLFRPSILKLSWLSDTEVRFRGYCNTGTCLITIDTENAKQPPITKKLSDKWLDE
jgi:hypothetical protein